MMRKVYFVAPAAIPAGHDFLMTTLDDGYALFVREDADMSTVLSSAWVAYDAVAAA